MNDTVRDYCQAEGITFTRCRPYRKNDQAWVEQKNGAVVRRIVGYRRFEGTEAAAALAQLHGTARLFVNFFQPSLKLAAKARDGARIKKLYHPPATPCQRLLADPRTPAAVRQRVQALRATLDPVQTAQPDACRPTASCRYHGQTDRQPHGCCDSAPRTVPVQHAHGVEGGRGAADRTRQGESQTSAAAS